MLLPRCHTCNIVYMKGRCILCGESLAAGPRKSRRKGRVYVDELGPGDI